MLLLCLLFRFVDNKIGKGYLYYQSEGIWILSQTIEDSSLVPKLNEYSEFGRSTAVNSNTLAVGAPGSDKFGDKQNSGAISFSFIAAEYQTSSPSSKPTASPSAQPTVSPEPTASTSTPTASPSFYPTLNPSLSPTITQPTGSPTFYPTLSPSLSPASTQPTVSPQPTASTSTPTASPTFFPTLAPMANSSTTMPTLSSEPTANSPTYNPTASDPTMPPSFSPTVCIIAALSRYISSSALVLDSSIL